MNPDEEIRKLEETKEGIVRFTKELDEKLLRKEVNGIEYHLLMSEKLCGKTKQELMGYLDSKIMEIKNKQAAEEDGQKRKHIITISAAAIILVMLAIVGILFTNPDALSGFAVYTPHIQTFELGSTFSQLTETQLNITNITSFKITGVLEGTGAVVRLRTDSGEYVVAEINNSGNSAERIITTEYSLKTDKTIYALGENVSIMINPAVTEKSVYIINGEETSLLDTPGETYTTTQPGEYKVRVLLTLPSDILRLETNFTVVNETGNERNETVQGDNTVIQLVNTTTNETNGTSSTYAFTELCEQTCTISETSNPVLIVEPAEGSSLTITSLVTVQNRENIAPQQIMTIPDITIGTGQEKTISLGNYFIEPDLETIQYDINSIPEVTTSISQDQLTMISSEPGEYTAYIYATDGNDLVTSNTFMITVIEGGLIINESTNETANITINVTLNETELLNLSMNITNGTNCSATNPNERPIECMYQNTTDFFPEQEIMLYDMDREPVARFTPIGNLLIKGEVITYSNSTPGTRDYRIGYVDIDGNNIATIWINTETGNLHLLGNLYEENANLEPLEGSFSIINRRSIFLAYADQYKGELHIRGNIIPYRQNLLKIK
ncbi:MAG: hypothetical protein V1866_00420 [archaeon]